MSDLPLDTSNPAVRDFLVLTRYVEEDESVIAIILSS